MAFQNQHFFFFILISCHIIFRKSKTVFVSFFESLYWSAFQAILSDGHLDSSSEFPVDVTLATSQLSRLSVQRSEVVVAIWDMWSLKHCAIYSQTLCNILSNTVQYTLKRCAIYSQTLRNILSNTVQYTLKHCAIYSQTLRNILSNTVQYTLKHCAIYSQTLCNILSNTVQFR